VVSIERAGNVPAIRPALSDDERTAWLDTVPCNKPAELTRWYRLHDGLGANCVDTPLPGYRLLPVAEIADTSRGYSGSFPPHHPDVSAAGKNNPGTVSNLFLIQFVPIGERTNGSTLCGCAARTAPWLRNGMEPRPRRCQRPHLGLDRRNVRTRQHQLGRRRDMQWLDTGRPTRTPRMGARTIGPATSLRACLAGQTWSSARNPVRAWHRQERTCRRRGRAVHDADQQTK
jgi:hypothetical protein